MADSDSHPIRRQKSAHFLLQPFRKWTPEHVEMAKVQVVENVDSQEIAPGYIPGDDDPDFNKIAKEFCLPTRHDFENNADVYCFPKGAETMFSIAFSALLEYSESVQASDPDSSWYTSNPCLAETIRAILRNMEWPKGELCAPRSIRIPQLSFKTKLREYRMISKIIKKDNFSVPLMFPPIVNASYDAETQIARHEVPQCLLQAILAYSKNPNLPQYTAFALCLHRTTIRVTKATIPQTYVKEFFQKAEINESMQLYRSEAFDLLDRDGRKGFLRLIMGVFRYIVEMEESNIILPD